MGRLIDRVHRELTEEDIAKIAFTYHNWKLDTGQLLKEAGEQGVTFELADPYLDVRGFCKSTITDEIRAHGYVLTPGRYVGAEDAADDDEPFEEKMRRLTAQLEEQFAESATLEKVIRKNLKGIRI